MYIISHFFLTYKCITEHTNIRLVRAINECFICILNINNWLIIKMNVIEGPLPNDNFIKMHILGITNSVSSFPNSNKYHV